MQSTDIIPRPGMMLEHGLDIYSKRSRHPTVSTVSLQPAGVAAHNLLRVRYDSGFSQYLDPPN